MHIVSSQHINLIQYGYNEHPYVWAIHIQIDHANFQEEGMALVRQISDSSWLSSFDIVDQRSFESKIQPTIEILSRQILQQSTTSTLSKIHKDFAEYLISINGQAALVQQGHTSVPLPELWKEKEKGNPGFDFHTISPNSLFVFGEAKFAADNTSNSRAIKQIADFLGKDKHLNDLSLLRLITQANDAAEKAAMEQIGIAAAFSVKQSNVQSMINNAIYHSRFKELLTRQEIYIIAVEIV